MRLRDEHYPSGPGCACGWQPSLLAGPQNWEQWREHVGTNMKRALAAERAALKADIYNRLAQPLQVIIIEAGMQEKEYVARAIERFAKELRELDTNRSA